MIRKRFISALFFAAALTFGAGQAHALAAGSKSSALLPSLHAETTSIVTENAIRLDAQQEISASTAKMIALAANPGATFNSIVRHDARTFRVRLQQNGGVFDVFVDVVTGQIKG